MEFDKKKSAGYLANHMARLFAQGLHERIKSLGLAPAQFMTLLELWNEDGLSQKELVKRIDVEQATMANTIRRMERDGLITRRQNPTDARSHTIFLTKRAKQIEQAAVEAAYSQNAVALDGFSQIEHQQFLESMQRTIANMKIT
ncbi:MAG: MarR family transcriptional regulator [Rhizobiaceae bacterium]